MTLELEEARPLDQDDEQIATELRKLLGPAAMSRVSEDMWYRIVRGGRCFKSNRAERSAKMIQEQLQWRAQNGVDQVCKSQHEMFSHHFDDTAMRLASIRDGYFAVDIPVSSGTARNHYSSYAVRVLVCERVSGRASCAAQIGTRNQHKDNGRLAFTSIQMGKLDCSLDSAVTEQVKHCVLMRGNRRY